MMTGEEGMMTGEEGMMTGEEGIMRRGRNDDRRKGRCKFSKGRKMQKINHKWLPYLPIKTGIAHTNE